jgi:hypothetical protein
MNKIKVISYEPGRKSEWDAFVARAKNGIFLFHRAYLEYHAERFPDASLMFYGEDERLVALLPATIRDTTLSSHAGLTFGGVVSNTAMKASMMLEIFDAMRANLIERGLTRVVYKAVPHIYHRLPAEEDLYALYRHDAKMVRRDMSSAILLRDKLPFSKGRKWAIKQAQKNGLEVRKSDDFKSFMAIEEQVLEVKHNLRPVHTAEEIQMLAGRFPGNINLFSAYSNNTMVAGVVVYEGDIVAHAQYLAANDEGKQKGALDLILDYLINDYYRNKNYFDFGISTEDDGRYLNSGLVENKQSFGARAIVHDFYEIDLT